MDHALSAKLTLTLRALLSQNVTQVRLLALKTTRSSLFKALGSALVRFHFWHEIKLRIVDKSVKG
jgi:hypothetical protein